MKLSKASFRQEAFGDQQRRVGSKKSVQQGHSHFCARSVLALREHGKMARTPLAAFFNRPKRFFQCHLSNNYTERKDDEALCPASCA